MKVMISQPMRGKTNEQIKKEREAIVREIELAGDEVLETIFDNFDENASPISYLAKSIEFLDKADKILFMKGWEQARGCTIEHQVAVKYGKEIIYCN